jgi:hypothetical protein
MAADPGSGSTVARRLSVFWAIPRHGEKQESEVNLMTKQNKPCALDIARIEVLRKRIAQRDSLCLNDETYRNLRSDGFSRRDVERAVETMVAAGEAVVESSLSTVHVRIVGPREGGE